MSCRVIGQSQSHDIAAHLLAVWLWAELWAGFREPPAWRGTGQVHHVVYGGLDHLQQEKQGKRVVEGRKSLWISLYELATSHHWDFCPFLLLAKLAQLLQGGRFALVNSNL